MADHFYVYCWTNRVNGKRYVGKGHGTRAHYHVRTSRHANPKGLLAIAMKKYGLENFTLEYLVKDIPEDHANAWERGYIDLFQTNKSRGGHGYNLTDGGDGFSGLAFSDEHKKKIAASLHGRQLGGHPHAEEAKKKIGAAHRGRKHTPQARANFSPARKAELAAAEPEMFAMWQQGMNYVTIAKHFKCSPSKVAKAVQRLKTVA